MAKHLAAAREKALAHPHNDAEIKLRRAKVNELWGAYSTNALMLQAVNAHMQSLNFPPISMATLLHDKKIVGQQFAQTFAEYHDVLIAEHVQELELLKNHQWEDYIEARVKGGNVAPLSDAVRKTLLTLGQMDGSVKQTTEVTGNLTFEMKLKEALATRPEGAPEVKPLVKDGNFELLPAPVKADG